MPCPSKLHSNEATIHLCSELRAWSTPRTGSRRLMSEMGPPLPLVLPSPLGHSSTRHRAYAPSLRVALSQDTPGQRSASPREPSPGSAAVHTKVGARHIYLQPACLPTRPRASQREGSCVHPQSPVCAVCALPPRQQPRPCYTEGAQQRGSDPLLLWGCALPTPQVPLCDHGRRIRHQAGRRPAQDLEPDTLPTPRQPALAPHGRPSSPRPGPLC